MNVKKNNRAGASARKGKARSLRETSAGAVVFRLCKKPLFLILQYRAGHWGFPKGHVENGEELLDTAQREISEETSIDDLSFLYGKARTIKYSYKEGSSLHKKTVHFFIAMTKQKAVVLSEEHKGYAWLDEKRAVKRITYDEDREILAFAAGNIKKDFKQPQHFGFR